MKDLTWLRPDGTEMTGPDWGRLHTAFGLRLCGLAMDDVNDRGEPITDDTLLILLNAEAAPVDFVLADPLPGLRWELVVDTADETGASKTRTWDQGAGFARAGRAVALLRACDGASHQGEALLGQ